MAKNKVYMANYYLPQNEENFIRVVVEESKEKAQELLCKTFPGAHAIALMRVRKKKPGVYPKLKNHDKAQKKDHEKTVNLG